MLSVVCLQLQSGIKLKRNADVYALQVHRFQLYSETYFEGGRHIQGPQEKTQGKHRWSNNEECQMNVRLACFHRSQAAKQELAGLLLA